MQTHPKVPHPRPEAQEPDPFMNFLIGGGPLDPMRRIIDRDTKSRVGNGLRPVPPVERTITSLYECGRPIPDIALAREVEVADVLDALGAEFYCSDCGRVTGLTATEDAYGAPMLGCEHCGALCLNRRGNVVEEDPREDGSRWMEEAS